MSKTGSWHVHAQPSAIMRVSKGGDVPDAQSEDDKLREKVGKSTASFIAGANDVRCTYQRIFLKSLSDPTAHWEADRLWSLVWDTLWVLESNKRPYGTFEFEEIQRISADYISHPEVHSTALRNFFVLHLVKLLVEQNKIPDMGLNRRYSVSFLQQSSMSRE